ncbi:MAG TPA: beta-propeller fold lactonase family protein [Candidatus Acidoferrum sp.]|nr:beta-propeller fold lactonase family protein [Candidatus Acidoferrum sp.]
MLGRRTFLSLVAGSFAVPQLAAAQQASRKVALYANVGADLTHYDVDVAGQALIKQATVTLPAGVQYAWPHASRRYLYVATSSSASGYGPAGTEHHVTAFRIDPASGALTRHGEPIRLPTRPIHMTTDIPSENILVAFNNPSALRVYRINKDFTPGEEVKQPGAIAAGIFAHQVRVTPDNRQAVLVTRGNEVTPTKAEDPGALKVFDYKNGVLTNAVSIAPNGGREFGPRHLDFHPTKPWMYVSIETQNKMYTYKMDGGRIHPEIAFRAETLAEPNNIRSRQAAGTVHVHPNGRFLYGANRAQDTIDVGGKKVFKGGENGIAVYSINQSTGEPTLIQNVETRAIHPRTFHIDPSGRLLVAQHNLPVNVRDGDAIRTLPAGLSVLSIGDDGKLTFVRKYDVEVGDKLMFWMGMVSL